MGGSQEEDQEDDGKVYFIRGIDQGALKELLLSRRYVITAEHPGLLYVEGAKSRLELEEITPGNWAAKALPVSWNQRPKISAIIPTTGNVAVLVKTSVPESIQVSIDMGTTKLPIFTLNVPYQGSEDDEARKIAYEGASALLDEMAAFLLERMVNRDVIIAVYASALSAFETLKPESVVSEFFQEEPLKMWEQEFVLPVEFAQEVSRRIITASVKWRLSLDDTKYAPKGIMPIHHPGGRVQNVKKTDEYAQAMKAIQKYRNQTLQRQSGPLYVLVYNSNGRPVGVQQTPKVNQNKIWKLK